MNVCYRHIYIFSKTHYPNCITCPNTIYLAGNAYKYIIVIQIFLCFFLNAMCSCSTFISLPFETTKKIRIHIYYCRSCDGSSTVFFFSSLFLVVLVFFLKYLDWIEDLNRKLIQSCSAYHSLLGNVNLVLKGF